VNAKVTGYQELNALYRSGPIFLQSIFFGSEKFQVSMRSIQSFKRCFTKVHFQIMGPVKTGALFLDIFQRNLVAHL
jgi:hypothetical protein